MAKRNKPMISASVSPYLKEEAEKLVKMGKFGSTSDLVSIALAEFIGRYKREHYVPAETYESAASSEGEPVKIVHELE
jgi:Arc/MetJ-type ribon-helix-helix transcriptional regulator